MPEHIWKDVSEKEVKSYAAEPEDGKPVVGSGPFRLVEGTAGGSTYRFEANPDYWQGAPHIDEVVFRVYKSEDPAVQALIKGEVDFVEGIPPLQVEALQGEPGITAQNGDSPGFDEIAFNTGSVDLETGEPIGDPNPALLDPKFRHALGYAIDRDVIIEKVYQGAGEPGHDDHPAGVRRLPLGAAGGRGVHLRPGQGRRSCWTRPATRWAPTGSRTMPDGDADRHAAAGRALGLADVARHDGLLQGVARRRRHRRRGRRRYESSKLTDVILEGNFDAFEWGWYVEPDPDSMLSYMTCGQLGNWSDSWYCNEEYDALYEQQHVEIDQDDAAEMVKQMQQILYEDSPYLVTAYSTIGEAFRSDRFACFQPQPDPGGIWLVQYGVHNYLNMRPAAEAGDCDATSARRRPKASAPRDDGISTGVMIGVGVARASWSSLVGGVVMMRRRRRRTTASDVDRRPAADARRRRGGRTGGPSAAAATAGTPAARCSARSAACCSCWW